MEPINLRESSGAKKAQILGPALVVLTLVFTYLVLPARLYGPMVASADASFRYALHRALLSGLSFSDDVVYTYGPLGVLGFRLPIGDVFWIYVVFDVFLLFSILYLFSLVALRTRSVGAAAFFCWIALLLPPTFAHLDVSHTLLALEIFFAWDYCSGRFGKRYRLSAIILVELLALLLTLYKINFGVIALLIFLLTVSVAALWRRSLSSLLVHSAFFACLLMCAGLAFEMNIVRYLKNGILFIIGYPETMGLHEPNLELFYIIGASVLIAVACFAVCHWRDLISVPISAVFFWVSFLFLFVCFKQGFVRGDVWHIGSFFGFAPVGAALCWLTLGTSGLQRRFLPILCMCAVFSTGFFVIAPDEVDRRGSKVHFLNFLREVVAPAMPPMPLPSRPPLPSELLASLGSASVDIFPWEVSYAYRHNLNYLPRPTIQSFSSCHPTLDRLNSDHFQSGNIPEHLIVEHHCLDLRYCFFEEPLTRQAILERYRFASRFNDVLLLERRPHPLTFRREFLSRIDSALAESISIPSDDELIIARIDLRYSTFGNVASFFLRPPSLWIEFELLDGTTHVFRVLRSALGSGVPINRFINSVSDQRILYEERWGDLPQIRSVRLLTSGVWAYKPSFSVEFYRMAAVE